MKLQPSSKKEIKRIAVGIAVCDVIMIAGLFLLSQFGMGTFSYRIFIGALGGSLIAIVNFTIMCLTVQYATNFEEQKKMKAFFQASYNGRLMLQALWVIVCFLVPAIHLIAGAAPLLFPSVIILYLQMHGKLMPPDPPRDPAKVIPEEDDEEDVLGPFEV
ncbi:MAG: ATP synthase subunit I [Firmicutes bacterium]|nr:ATP synthase subunit I [Bacillota bacterium]